MKIILLLLLSFFSIFSQDLEIYQKSESQNIKINPIPISMTYEEFRTLSTNIKLIDYFYAMILPGHIHFKIDEKKVGYTLVGLRVAGFVGIFGGAMYAKNRGNTLFHSFSSGVVDQITNTKIDSNAGDLIAMSSVVLVLGTYFYDFIAGRYDLDNKKKFIKYKYGLKLSIHNSNTTTGIGVSYDF